MSDYSPQEREAIASQLRESVRKLFRPTIEVIEPEEVAEIKRDLAVDIAIERARIQMGGPTSAEYLEDKKNDLAETMEMEIAGEDRFWDLLTRSIDAFAQGDTAAPRALYTTALRANEQGGANADFTDEFAEKEFFTFQWLREKHFNAWDQALKSCGL